MLYRVLRDLSTGHQPGDLVDGAQFKRLEALIEARALAPVSYPPLSEIPGWKLRSEKLAEIGITTASEFLEADDDSLKHVFGYKTTRMITKWKNELRDWLVVDEPEKKR